MDSLVPQGRGRAAAVAAVVESLEPRTLFATADVDVRVNFQPSTSAVPTGYLADTGAAFGNRGNGHTYGWDQANPTTRDRNSSLSPDQRYDTLNHLQKDGGNRRWELAVPNGTYRVRVVAGDANHYNSVYRVSVEGTTAVDGAPTSAARWVEGVVTVDVADGRITVGNAAGASNNKICFIDVESVDAFVTFDGTMFKGKPDLAAAGMAPIYVAGAEFFAGTWPNLDTSKPDEAATRAVARRAASLGQPVVIDIEHWNVDVRYASASDVQANTAKLAQVADWLHDERPGLKVGFYGLMPLRDYWTPVQYLNALASPDNAWYAGNLPKFKAGMDAWRNANAALDGLARHVDFICPSLYTFYENRTEWTRYAEANIEQARRYGKPVYPFLWMNYHDSNAQLAGQQVPDDYFRLQLDTADELADGVVIWGGYLETWDPSAGWWKATSAFLQSRPVPAGKVGYAGADNATRGDWSKRYGTGGYDLFNGARRVPREIDFAGDNVVPHRSSTATTDARAPALPDGRRVLGEWRSPTSMTVHLHLDPDVTSRLALYLVDWNNAGIGQRIELIDPTTGAVLDSRTASGFSGGRYLTYNVSGRLDLRITRLSGPNAVLNGVFFD